MVVLGMTVPAVAQELADDPQLIFQKTTVWRMLSPNATLDTYVIDDPVVQGVACYFTMPQVGGWKGWAGFADERSETSIACRQVGPIKFAKPLRQQDEIFSERTSLVFKRLRVVRMVDAKRNALVYLTYSDRLIEGSPQNAVTAVAVDRAMPIPVK
jgi:CreA protein